MITRGQVVRELGLFSRRNLRPPTLHLVQRLYPLAQGQPLLNDEVGAVTDRTTNHHQPFAVLLIRDRWRGFLTGVPSGPIVCERFHQWDAYEHENGYQTNHCRSLVSPTLHQRSHVLFTSTWTRSTPFHRKPPGFHGLAIGWGGPRSSVARARML